MKITKRSKPIILQFQTDLDMKRSYKRKSQFWTQLLETVMLWIAAKREENSSFYLSKKDRSSKFPKAIKRFYVRVLGSLSFSLSFSVLFGSSPFPAFLQFFLMILVYCSAAIKVKAASDTFISISMKQPKGWENHAGVKASSESYT